MTDDLFERGVALRRQVLGDDYVEHMLGDATALTEDFQRLITRYAWGEVWSRQGLDLRMRSAITLMALIAQKHHDLLATHIRGAIQNGLTPDEIKEIVLHGAIYCGVPSANSAFKIASRVLEEVPNG